MRCVKGMDTIVLIVRWIRIFRGIREGVMIDGWVEHGRPRYSGV